MAGNRPLKLVVITPERRVLETDADSVVIPAHDGELGILPGRAALMCELGIGRLRYRHAGRGGAALIDGGFAQVVGNTVTVLTPQALRSDEVSEDRLAGAEREVAAAATPDARRQARRRLAVMRRVGAS